jgi:ADP-heptose:LPS heptosyltransferase
MTLSPSILLKIDKWFGGLNYLTNRFQPKVSNQVNKNTVVVIKLAGMGSIIRLFSLCQKHCIDLSKVTLITFASQKEVCQFIGLQHCWYIRTDTLYHFFHDCFKIRKRIKETRPEWIIDFERCSNAVSIFRQWLAHASLSKTISFDTKGAKDNSTTHLRFDVKSLSFFGMLKKGIEYMPISLPIERKIQQARNTKKVLVNINASELLMARRYPINLFREVIIQLHRHDRSLEFYFTGSQNEREYVEKLMKDLNGLGFQLYNQAGSWSISQLAEELSNTALFVTGDSGPLHLAVHLGTPTVAIWGPTQPSHFGYANNDQLINATQSLSCSPCFLHPKSKPTVACGGKILCLQQLQPSQIVLNAIRLLKRMGQSHNTISTH